MLGTSADSVAHRDHALVKCQCGSTNENHGDAAVEYAERHLLKVAALPGGQWLYRCPATGADWIYNFPPAPDTGHGGRARLRRVEFREPL